MRLLRSIFMVLTGYFALLGLGITILGVLAGIFFYKHFDGESLISVERGPKASVPLEDVIVRIKLDRPLSIESIDDRSRLLSRLFSDNLPILVDDVQMVLRRAAADARVKGVLIDVENSSADLSTLSSLRRSLEQYVASNKPLYVHLNEGDSSFYFLGSAATKLNLAPVSGLTIPGPSLQLTYFGSALEKLGVQLEVVKAGKYKAAMEAFVQDAPSTETTEMYQSLEGSLRQSLVASIAAGRKKTPEEVAQWLRRSLFTSQQALAQGLVDRIGYLSDWEEELKKEAQAKDFVDDDHYLSGSDSIDTAQYSGDDQSLGLIEATGEIVMGSGGAGGGVITPERLIEQLQWAKADAKIKAVVLRVDSPGGSALASDLIWDEVKKLVAVKPVVVSMGSVAASGGYYISAPASLIIAEPTTITGSIGVVGAIPKGLQVGEKWGVHFHVITGSDRKNYLNFGTPSTAEDKALLGESIKEVYDTFVNKVAEGRKQPPQRVFEIAEGRVYTGAEAQKLGLVDRLGGLKEAMQAAKELAKLDSQKLYTVKRFRPKARNLLDCLVEDKMWECVSEIEGGASLGIFKAPVRGLEAVTTLERLMTDSTVLAYWPGSVSWTRQKSLNGLH